MKQKPITTNIMDELVATVECLEKLPTDKKESKQRRDGFFFGAKYIIARLAELVDPKDNGAVYKELIGWERKQEKLFSKEGWKKLKEVHKRAKK